MRIEEPESADVTQMTGPKAAPLGGSRGRIRIADGGIWLLFFFLPNGRRAAVLAAKRPDMTANSGCRGARRPNCDCVRAATPPSTEKMATETGSAPREGHWLDVIGRPDWADSRVGRRLLAERGVCSLHCQSPQPRDAMPWTSGSGRCDAAWSVGCRWKIGGAKA